MVVFRLFEYTPAIMGALPPSSRWHLHLDLRLARTDLQETVCEDVVRAGMLRRVLSVSLLRGAALPDRRQWFNLLPATDCQSAQKLSQQDP